MRTRRRSEEREQLQNGRGQKAGKIRRTRTQRRIEVKREEATPTKDEEGGTVTKGGINGTVEEG